MSEGPPSTTAALVEALRVRRNAKVGFAAGALVGAGAYAYRVGELGGPTYASYGSPLLFALLAFVLAVTAGALVTAALTARAAIRLAREPE